MTDLKIRFEQFLFENHEEFIKSFPYLDQHMVRLNAYTNTLQIEKYALDKISSNLLDKWLVNT